MSGRQGETIQFLWTFISWMLEFLSRPSQAFFFHLNFRHWPPDRLTAWIQRQRIAQEPLHIENLEDLQLGATLSLFVRISQNYGWRLWYAEMELHLVMTNSSPWKIPTINGGWCRWENHLQMGHLYHGYVSHNQRLFFFKGHFWRRDDWRKQMLPGFQLVPTHRSEAEPRVQILILGAPEDHWHCRSGRNIHDMFLWIYTCTI